MLLVIYNKLFLCLLPTWFKLHSTCIHVCFVTLLILVKSIFEIKCCYPLCCSDCTLLIAVCLPNSSNQHHNLTTIKDSGSIYKSNLLQQRGNNTDIGVFSNNNPAGNRISDFLKTFSTIPSIISFTLVLWVNSHVTLKSFT